MKRPDRSLLDQFADILRDELPPNRAPAVFEGSAAKTLAGLAVYRNNVRSSLSRVLGDKFPVLKQLVGADFFKFLAHSYFQTHPPNSPMLVHYGDQLAAFLEDFEPTQAYPYLPDVARLEALWLEAYHAADADIMTPDRILAEAGDDIAIVQFTMHPSVRLLSSAFPVAAIWQQHQTEAEPGSGALGDAGEAILISRPNKDVNIRVLSASTYRALDALQSGRTLEEAVMTASGADDTFDPQSFFQDLFQFEIIADVRHKKD